jgi:hypothetical protein
MFIREAMPLDQAREKARSSDGRRMNDRPEAAPAWLERLYVAGGWGIIILALLGVVGAFALILLEATAP